jgi:hypothetical protein
MDVDDAAQHGTRLEVEEQLGGVLVGAGGVEGGEEGHGVGLQVGELLGGGGEDAPVELG